MGNVYTAAPGMLCRSYVTLYTNQLERLQPLEQTNYV
jgi:hypothetical protein